MHLSETLSIDETALASRSSRWHRAYTLVERADGIGSAAPAADDDARISEWLQRSRLASDEKLGRKLAALGMSHAQFATLLREPDDSLRERLGDADWMAALDAAFATTERTFPLSASFTARPEAALIEPFAPLLEQAWRRLRAEAPTPERASIDDDVLSTLFADLPAELLELSLRVLIAELHRARSAGELTGDDERARFGSFARSLADQKVARALLERYPVLARQAVTRLELRVGAALDLLARLDADWGALVHRFGAPLASAGALVAVESNLGDSHRGGRGVARLRFASGFRLLYKPRPIRVEQHFQELLAWVNSRGVTTPFRPLVMLARDEYGWVEHIDPAACASRAEVASFYRRQGGYLALLYALRGGDVHYGNVIAAGEHPMLIDLESLCTPELDYADAQQRLRLRDTIDSVLHVGLLPHRSWNNDATPGVDVSGLGDPGGMATVQRVPVVEHAGTDRMCIARRTKTWQSGKNRPFLDGHAIGPHEQLADLEAGFIETYELLLRERASLLAADGPVARFAGDEVRCVLQPTSLYSVMLMESTHPSLTDSALRRDCFFDRLLFHADQAPYLARIEPAARRALERGDIPVFTCVAGSRHLLAEGDILRDLFPRSGMDCVRARFARLGEDDRNRQLAFIRNSVSVAALEPGSIESTRRPLPSAARAVTRDELLASASAIADRLHVLAARDGERATWTGLAPDAHQRWQLGAIGCDLYSGLGGIALFLGYLADVTDEPRHRTLAGAALQMALEHAEDPRERAPLHGLSGVAGLVYAATHLAALWEDRPLLARARALTGRVIAALDETASCDVVGGLAGDILALATLFMATGAPEVREALTAAARRIVERATPIDRGLGWISPAEGVALGGMAHGAAGIVLALVRAAALGGDRSLLSAASAGLRFEQQLFDGKRGDWRDVRPDAGAPMVAWCHGAAGIGLARLALIEQTRDRRPTDELRAAVAATLADAGGRNHSLCHGDLGNLELPFSVGHHLGDEGVAAAAAARLSDVVESISHDGARTGVVLGLESPGLMNGLAGVGYALLRFAAPDLVPSVLMLEPSRADYISPRAHARVNRAAIVPRPASILRSWSESLAAGIAFVRRAQSHDGALRDYLMPPGFSTGWISAHASFVLDGVAGCDELHTRAADYLEALGRRDGAWGFNRLTAPDADSTAQALWVLHRHERELRPAWIDRLIASQLCDGGFPTYDVHAGVGSGWSFSHPDVTVIVAHLLERLGYAREQASAVAWMRTQIVDGILPSYWWISHAYSLWAQAKTGLFCDRVAEHTERALYTRPCSPDLAQLIWSALAVGVAPASLDVSLAALVEQQRDDGSWPSMPCMRQTLPQEKSCTLETRGEVYPAVTGVFASVHAVAALSAALRRR